jgi:lysophospholipid acyltransferase (LPLAT)-like uncharacterized protein
MAQAGQTTAKKADLSLKGRLIGWTVVSLVRFFSLTYRWRLHDLAGITKSPPNHPMIWTLWHNRVFAILGVYRKYLRSRLGGVLTSPSKDGEIIAAMACHLKVDAVRGSSSRRGAAALVELKNRIRSGYDILIVPDGPRGPRYRFGPGAAKLAQLTDAKILPIRIEYSSYWKFRSWDQFRLPKPFSSVDIYFEPLVEVVPDLSQEDFRKECQKVETILNPYNETD